MVVDCDIGYANSLSHNRVLALPRQIENGRLCMSKLGEHGDGLE